MSQSKKFTYQVTENEAGWNVKIIRRVTARRTSISKSKGGFANEAEAEQWGKETLESFLENLANKNKKHSVNRKLADDEKARKAAEKKAKRAKKEVDS